LDAQAILKNSKKSRQIPLKEFFKGPGESCLVRNEILTELVLEKPATNSKAIFLKKGRVKMDLAIASVAVLLEVEHGLCKKARIGAGSVAPTPLRMTKVEALLENAIITPELIYEAQTHAKKAISPISDIRSTEEYRRHIVGVYIKRALEHLVS
jgi:carbon-monoxide dehydrogenase medium subunit